MSETRPQAGSQHSLNKTPEHENHAASAQASPTSVEPVAPQDAQAAGASEGEKHHLLHQNVSGSQQEGAAEKAENLEQKQPGGTAGIHATGSHAGAAEDPK